MLRWIGPGVALPILLMTAGAVGAQTVRGRLVMPAHAATPPGLLVELVDSTDRVVGRALSDSDGRFQLRAPRAGTFRVRALRIGFRPSISNEIALATAAEHALDLRLGSTAVVLNAVNVAERRICQVNPDTASQTAAAWGEALKALTLSEVTRATRRYHMRVALFTRQLDRSGRLLNQTQSERDGSTVQPFKAAPPDSLAQHGYVEIRGSHGTYHGPDAAVLLSDAFARTHCLRLVPRASTSPADSGWIGIAFQPIQVDRPDIEGVLWLDRHSRELREVEYGYVSLHPALAAARPGGRVVFHPLPLGGWIVREWWIRMPVPRVVQEVVLGSAQSRIEVTSLQETGGEVLTVSADDKQIWRGRTSGIRGQVIMESGASPAGVVLRVEDTYRRAVIDSTGRFSFDVLFPGRYTITVQASHLRALGQPPLRVPVSVGDSSVTSLDVVVPSPESVINRVCGEGTATDSLGLLRVIVSDSATSFPSADATVQGTWHQSFSRQGARMSATKTHRVGEQVGQGIFWLCAAPKDRVIDLEIRRGTRITKAEARIPFDAVFADYRVILGSP